MTSTGRLRTFLLRASKLSERGLLTVRCSDKNLTWHSNKVDVETVPSTGTWFQLIANGTTSVNEGPNGLQKLDTVVRLAEKHGIYLMLTLTNNWNPRPLFDGGLKRDVTPGTDNDLPRNTLSNDYGLF